MLRLAALAFAVDDTEVDFDGVAHGCVSVGRNLHKQHVLKAENRQEWTETGHMIQAGRRHAPAGSCPCPPMLPFPRFAAHLDGKTGKATL